MLHAIYNSDITNSSIYTQVYPHFNPISLSIHLDIDRRYPAHAERPSLTLKGRTSPACLPTPIPIPIPETERQTNMTVEIQRFGRHCICYAGEGHHRESHRGKTSSPSAQMTDEAPFVVIQRRKEGMPVTSPPSDWSAWKRPMIVRV